MGWFDRIQVCWIHLTKVPLITKMNTVITFFFVLITSATAAAQETQHDVVTDVSVPEFQDLIDSLQDEIVIDLRTEEELRHGKIPGAMVIDFFGPDFEPSIQKLEKNRVYLLYCASGGRSGETSELMRKMGFRKVYNLEGGFNEWAKAKMTISKK